MFLLENMCVVRVAEVALQVIWVPVTIQLRTKIFKYSLWVPVTINLKTRKYSNWTKHKQWRSILKHKQYFKIEQNIQDPSENIQTYRKNISYIQRLLKFANGRRLHAPKQTNYQYKNLPPSHGWSIEWIPRTWGYSMTSPEKGDTINMCKFKLKFYQENLYNLPIPNSDPSIKD